MAARNFRGGDGRRAAELPAAIGDVRESAAGDRHDEAREQNVRAGGGEDGRDARARVDAAGFDGGGSRDDFCVQWAAKWGVLDEEYTDSAGHHVCGCESESADDQGDEAVRGERGV